MFHVKRTCSSSEEMFHVKHTQSIVAEEVMDV